MIRHRSAAGALSLLLVFFFFLFCVSTVQAQQAEDYVGRFDAFTGFSYMASPSFNLYQRGFNGQFGVNVNRWLALGADFSVFDGGSSILPKELEPSLQQSLGQELQALAAAGQIPPGYSLYMPFDSKTFTIAVGPQLNYRHFKYVTLFIHPDLGAIHERAELKPVDPIQTVIAGALAPGNKKNDTVVFYGVGGGFDLNASKHVALRVTVDYVHCDLFADLLKDARNSVRISVGPTLRFGKNVEK
jgi:opacity protein-like surface antigen